jgi:uncharacterized protein YjbI with pentapeptide repeats
MTSDPVTLTLHSLTWQDVYFILSLLSFPIAATVLWFIPKDAKTELRGIFAIFGTVWLWILMQTLLSLWQVFNGGVKDAPLAGDSLGLGALIVAFLGAPFVIYGTWLKHRTVEIESAKFTVDRFDSSKFLEQLGAMRTVTIDGKDESVPNIEVRMGAILSLERIAQDSTVHDKGRDHVRVMEIFCAYIRENSNARKPVDFPLAEWVPLKDNASEEERAEHEKLRKARFDPEGGPLARQWAQNLPKPRADVQLALTVIGRRNAEQRRVEAAWPDAPTKATVWPFDLDFKRLPDDPGNAPVDKETTETFKAGLDAWKAKLQAYRGYRLDLRGANLQGADMAAKQPDGSDAVFSGALLQGARIEGANLRMALIVGALLEKAQMKGGDFENAKMDSAVCWEVQMEGTILNWVHINGADIWEARMEGAYLMGARMERTTISEVGMEAADLSAARVDGAEFTETQMEGAVLTAARMEGASLNRVRMDGSTTLSVDTLAGAALRHMDCRAMQLSDDHLRMCFGDATVILPKGIRPPWHWPDWELPDFGEHSFKKEWREWYNTPHEYYRRHEHYTSPPKPE